MRENNIQLNSDASIEIIDVSISSLEHKLDSYKRFLTPEEIKKSKRFHFAKDQIRFILARGLLREHLSHHINKVPQSIQFLSNRFGKPYIESDDLYFNVSHSGNKILLIFSNKPVGIDVEQLKTDTHYLALAKRFFTQEEHTYLNELPSNQRQEGFFKLWVCKEAVIKAIGRGLSHDLKSFTIDIAKSSPEIQFSNKEMDISLDFITTDHAYFAAYAVINNFSRDKFAHRLV